MERHRVEALQSYKTAMAGVTLPTTDEHLSTFHAFSSEDALERLREAMRCSDSGGAPVDSASAAAAEREVQDQIAEYVTEAQPSAHDPRTLVQARQLRGGAFAALWEENVRASHAAYAAWIDELHGEIERKRDEQAYRSILEYELDVSKVREKLGADERWSAVGRKLATQELEAKLNTDRAVVLELLYSERVGQLEAQLKSAVQQIAALQQRAETNSTAAESTAAQLGELQEAHEHLKAESADRHAYALELEGRVQVLESGLAAQSARADEALQAAQEREAAAAAQQQQLLQQVVKEQGDRDAQREQDTRAAEARELAARQELVAKLAAHVEEVQVRHNEAQKQRQVEEARWDKSARELDRMRLEIFESSKSQRAALEAKCDALHARAEEHDEAIAKLGHGDVGGAGGGAGGNNRPAKVDSSQLSEHTRMLREHTAQLQQLQSTQAEQHQLLLAAVEEQAQEGSSRAALQDQGLGAVRDRLEHLEGAHEQSVAAKRESDVAREALGQAVDDERTRTREALAALQSSAAELHELYDDRWQQQDSMLQERAQELAAVVDSCKDELQAESAERLQALSEANRQHVKELREQSAALAALERQQAETHAARDDALAMARDEMRAEAATQAEALATIQKEQKRANDTAATARAKADEATRVHRTATDTALQQMASEVRDQGKRNEARLEQFGADQRALQEARGHELTQQVLAVERQLSQHARTAEIADEQRQLKFEELALAHKTAQRTNDAQWEKNGRELDRLRVDHVEALRAHAEEQELKWKSSEQSMEWLQQNVKAQTGSSYTELRSLVDRYGGDIERQAERVDKQAHVLQRLQEGVLEVHQVEMTSAVKALDERQALKWEATDARLEQIQQGFRVLEERCDAQQAVGGAAEWVERAEQTLRLTVEELKEPLELERIRTREAHTEVRRLVVEQQDRVDEIDAKLQHDRVSDGQFRDSLEVVESSVADIRESVGAMDVLAKRHNDLAATVEEFIRAETVKWSTNELRYEQQVVQREKKNQLMMAAIAAEAEERQAAELRHTARCDAAENTATTAAQNEAQLQFDALREWMDRRQKASEHSSHSLDQRLGELEEWAKQGLPQTVSNQAGAASAEKDGTVTDKKLLQAMRGIRREQQSLVRRADETQSRLSDLEGETSSLRRSHITSMSSLTDRLMPQWQQIRDRVDSVTRLQLELRRQLAVLRGSAGDLVAVEHERKTLSTEANKRSSPTLTFNTGAETPERKELSISSVTGQAKRTANTLPRMPDTDFTKQDGDASSACLMAEMEAIVNARVAALSRDTEEKQGGQAKVGKKTNPSLASKQTALSIELEGHQYEQQQEHQQCQEHDEHQGHKELEKHEIHEVCGENMHGHSMEQTATSPAVEEEDRAEATDVQEHEKEKEQRAKTLVLETQAEIDTKPTEVAHAQQLSLEEVEVPNSSMPPLIAGFVGRISTLGAMQSSLGAIDRLVVLALLGPEGSGKSALVSEYLHLYSDSYTFVWWFTAETVAQMDDGLRSLARQMGLKSDDTMPSVRTRVHSQLVRTPGWCIALDSVLDADALAACIPWDEEVGGHVLVTSRDQGLSDAHAFRHLARQDALVCLQVGALEPADTIELLLAGTGEADKEAAAAVAQLVSHHAASAAQVAAQIRADDTNTLADYCIRLADGQQDDEPGSADSKSPHHMHRSADDFNDDGNERPFV